MHVDFRSRFLTLLSFPKFRDFGSVTALSILEAVNNFAGVKELDKQGGGVKALTPTLLPTILTPFDLKRLEAYGNNILDFHVILDLMPTISQLFFQRRIDSRPQEGGDGKKSVSLSAVQSAILLGMGLQRKSVEDMEVRTLVVMPLPWLRRVSRRNLLFRYPKCWLFSSRLFAKSLYG